MILLLSFLTLLSSDPPAVISVVETRPNTIDINVDPGLVPEGQCHTRFILAPAAPVIELVAASGPDRPRPGPRFVTIGPPHITAGYRLYPVIVDPSQTHAPGPWRFRISGLSHAVAPLSGPLAAVYGGLILNYQYDPAARPAGLMIVTPVTFAAAIQPLAEWKEKKGWTVTVATLAQTGTTAAAIKDYITNAYQTWSPRLEYVILVGDKDSLPTFTLYSNPTDHPFSTVDGADYFSDLMVGRLSVANVNDLNTVVAKIVGYEKNPYTADTAWFRRALMVGANYPSNMTTPVPVKRLVRERLRQDGYSAVDTVYYPPTAGGQAPITSAVNQGVAFINYRGGLATWGGWDYPSFYNADVQGLANGWKLPVITSIVCLNGNYNAEPCFGESWLRAGNPVTPKGGVGFFGASPATTHSRWNNCLDQGIYWGLIEEDIHHFGPMTYRGKIEVYLNFPLETSPTSGTEFYFNAYNLLGDPSLELWTGVPRALNVSHPAAIPTGTSGFTVTVRDAANQPVPAALVSLYKLGETKAIDFTDAAGQATLPVTADTPDTLYVTVTKHDHRPYCGHAIAGVQSVYVGYAGHTLADAGGNNNGQINPGEIIQMAVTLKNFGNATTADNVSAKLTCGDPGIVITDSIRAYGSIAPGDTAVAAPFAFQAAAGINNGHRLSFDLAVSSSQGNWPSLIVDTVYAPALAYSGRAVMDAGNGELEPGEAADFTVRIRNQGGLSGINLTANLRSLNPGVTVVDSLGTYGTIAVGDSAANDADRFRLQAAPDIAPGHEIDLLLFVSGDAGLRDTLGFTLPIGVVTQAAPTGPDGYGYYAYDNTDTGYPEAPVYSWIEIDPGFGGAGTELVLANDETRTIGLPFAFRYYGADYLRISVCSNGYAALDSTWIADMYNWRIPSAGGPPLMIAPFWDDLDPTATDSSRGVYHYLDAGNHRFIIEWSRVQHIHDPTNPNPAELQTFQMILYDPVYHPTQTGDGEIVFQYLRINNDDYWHDYATVGIEDHGHVTGLEYTFANMYPASAAPLADGRAIKFTTDQPDPYPGVEDANDSDRSAPLFTISPNPARSRIEFKLDPGKENRAPLRGSGASHEDFRTPSIEFTIYDIAGRIVRSFTLPSAPCSMPYALCWDLTDRSGHSVPAGIYFAVLRWGGGNAARKLVIIE